MRARRSTDDLVPDPFAEKAARCYRRTLAVLGNVFEFQSPCRALIGLVDAAYARLPAGGDPRGAARFAVRLQATEGPPIALSDGHPPPVRTLGGAGLLLGVMDAANLAAVNPASRSALVAISRPMLAFPYHARYELLEFAVFTLASRALGLAPLHAGCIGRQGRGLLVLGASGAGKSSLALMGQAQGLDILSEDATFVAPQSLLAHGVANYLHLRTDGLDIVDDATLAAAVRASPIIRRRSGVEKFELDLRQSGLRPAPGPLQIVGTVLMSTRPAVDGAMLVPLSARAFATRLKASQAYAAGLPGWAALARGLASRPAWELRRGAGPRIAAQALRELLDRPASSKAG